MSADEMHTSKDEFEPPLASQRVFTLRSVFNLEYLLAVIIVICFMRACILLFHDKVLPPPFFYDVNDTWMDWFNTAWWAHNGSVYETWQTVYPPLSFLFLKFVTPGACYVGEVGDARDCDMLGRLVLHSFYILDVILVAKTFLKINSSTALSRSLAICLGTPLLFGLDRGNLIVVTFSAFILAYGPLVKSARLRWIMSAITINFKVYLIGSLLPLLVKRKWVWVESTLIITGLVYLITFAILGEGSLSEIVKNLSGFAESTAPHGVLDAWYTVSYNPLITIVNQPDSVLTIMGGSRITEFVQYFGPVMMHCVQVLIIGTCLAAWLRPQTIPPYRLVNLATCFTFITVEPGGYALVLVIFLAFMEPWKGLGRKSAIVAGYILSIPADIVIVRLPTIFRENFFAGTIMSVQYPITFGPFVRPLVTMVIPIALCCVTLRQVLRAPRDTQSKLR